MLVRAKDGMWKTNPPFSRVEEQVMGLKFQGGSFLTTFGSVQWIAAQLVTYQSGVGVAALRVYTTCGPEGVGSFLSESQAAPLFEPARAGRGHFEELVEES